MRDHIQMIQEERTEYTGQSTKDTKVSTSNIQGETDEYRGTKDEEACTYHIHENTNE